MSKDLGGEIVGVELSDLSDDQRAEFGAIAGALIGLGVEPDEEGVEAGALAGAEAAEDGLLGDETMWSIADTIPMGTTAAVALIEHRWAIPLRDAIRRDRRRARWPTAGSTRRTWSRSGPPRARADRLWVRGGGAWVSRRPAGAEIEAFILVA